MLQGRRCEVSQGQTGVQGSGSCCTGQCGRRASLGNLTANRLYLIPARPYEKFNAWSSAKVKTLSLVTFPATVSLKGNNR